MGLACWFGNAAADVATCFWGHLALCTYILYHTSYIIYLEKNQSIHDNHTLDQIGKNKLTLSAWFLHPLAAGKCQGAGQIWPRSSRSVAKSGNAEQELLECVSKKGLAKSCLFPTKISQPFPGPLGISSFEVSKMLCWGENWWNLSTNAGWVWCCNKVAETWNFWEFWCPLGSSQY